MVPEVTPASAAIDWSVLGPTIGERTERVNGARPLTAKTIARIEAGIAKHYGPDLRSKDRRAGPAGFIMRNNGSRGDGGEHCTSLDEPLRTITTKGHQSLVTLDPDMLGLVVPYYSNGNAQPSSSPLATIPTRDRFALATGSLRNFDFNDVHVRMLLARELQAGMGFLSTYVVTGNDKQVKAQLGNGVTPSPLKFSTTRSSMPSWAPMRPTDNQGNSRRHNALAARLTRWFTRRHRTCSRAGPAGTGPAGNRMVREREGDRQMLIDLLKQFVPANPGELFSTLRCCTATSPSKESG